MLNFIVNDILSALKVGYHSVATEACDLLLENKKIRQHCTDWALNHDALDILDAPATTSMENL